METKDGEVDYSRYNLSELRDVETHIDARRNPRNYVNLKQAILERVVERESKTAIEPLDDRGKIYSEKDVSFAVPKGWHVVEDDFDDVIRSILIECPNEGLYMIDVYKREYAPNVDNYVDRQIRYFARELPRGFKILDNSVRTPGRARRDGKDVLGLHVALEVQTPYRENIEYLNSYYRVETGAMVSLISCQYRIELHSQSRSGVEQIVTTYRAA